MSEPTGGAPILLVDSMTAAIKPMIAPLEAVGLWEFADRAAFLAQCARDIRVIATHGGPVIDTTLVEALPNLGLIISVGAGYDGIDIAHARARGITVANGAGANRDDVAELVLALLLGSVCRLGEAEARLREGRWAKGASPSDIRWSLKERRVGIVGLGFIGRAVAERLAPFGCAIAWHGPRPKPDAPWPRVETVAGLAAQSDVLIVAAALSDATRHLIDRQVLTALGPKGLLVNVARGGLVDEAALIEMLRAGALGGAALDVFEEEPTPPDRWAGVPNVLLTPHIGGQGTAGFANLAALLRENLRLFFAGEPVLTPVFS